MKKDVTQRCNQKCRDRARDKNKPRKSRHTGNANKQQTQEQMSTVERISSVESKLDSLLDGQLQLMQAVFGLPCPAIQCHVRIIILLLCTVYYYKLGIVDLCSMICPLLKVFLAFLMIYWIHHGIWTPSSCRTDHLSTL